MRYRIKEYYVDKGSEYIQVTFPAPADFVDSLDLASGSEYELNSASTQKVIEAIRLIADETQGGYVICSTGQKGVVTKAWKNVEQENDLRIQISIAELIAAADGDADDLAAIDAMSITDMYTIEMDCGEAPADIGGGGDEYSQDIAQFFGITGSTEFVAATSIEILNELEDIWREVTGESAPVVSMSGLDRVHDNNTGDTYYIVQSNDQVIG